MEEIYSAKKVEQINDYLFNSHNYADKYNARSYYIAALLRDWSTRE